MARELITSWGDYQMAIDRLLALAKHKICIFDEDLDVLRLDSPSRLAAIRELAHTIRSDGLNIAVRNATHLRLKNPLLIALLATHGHTISMQQTPAQLSQLRDSMLLIDDRHGLIRFDHDQPRSKLLIDETDELQPYHRRFKEIWNEGGESISASTLGL